MNDQNFIFYTYNRIDFEISVVRNCIMQDLCKNDQKMKSLFIQIRPLLTLKLNSIPNDSLQSVPANVQIVLIIIIFIDWNISCKYKINRLHF